MVAILLCLNKKLSDLRNRKDTERVYFCVCDGQSKQSPHASCILKADSIVVTTDSFGRFTMKVARVFRFWIEDADLHEELDKFKMFMRTERGKRLPANE